MPQFRPSRAGKRPPSLPGDRKLAVSDHGVPVCQPGPWQEASLLSCTAPAALCPPISPATCPGNSLRERKTGKLSATIVKHQLKYAALLIVHYGNFGLKEFNAKTPRRKENQYFFLRLCDLALNNEVISWKPMPHQIVNRQSSIAGPTQFPSGPVQPLSPANPIQCNT